MHQTIAGNEGAILNNDVAPEQRAVGDNHLTAHLRVVPHMTMRHEKIVRPDHRLLGFIVRAMQRDVFADRVLPAHEIWRSGPRHDSNEHRANHTDRAARPFRDGARTCRAAGPTSVFPMRSSWRSLRSRGGSW